MSSINKRISYMYIEYATTFHMKYKHLFTETIYDSERVDTCTLIITWAEADMAVGDGNNKCLAVSTKSALYDDSFQVTEAFFEDALQAFSLFPDNTTDDDDETSELRLEFVKALLNK